MTVEILDNDAGAIAFKLHIATKRSSSTSDIRIDTKRDQNISQKAKPSANKQMLARDVPAHIRDVPAQIYVRKIVPLRARNDGTDQCRLLTAKARALGDSNKRPLVGS
jgi:hypothetical protein